MKEKASTLVGTSVGSQAAFPDNPRHSVSQGKEKKTFDNHNKIRTSNVVCLQKSQYVIGGKIKQETGLEPAAFSLATRSSTN